MSKKWLTYIIFFSLLLVAFYYFLFRGTNNWKVQLPVLSYVQPFQFTNAEGQAFSDKELLHKVTVVEYFFTTCKGICPKLNTHMKDIYEVYKNEPDFQIVSHTCNPGTDSVPVLKRYADSLKVDTKKWIFFNRKKR